MKKKLKLNELNVKSFITSESASIIGASAPVCVNPDSLNHSNLPNCVSDGIDCMHATTESQATNCDIVCLNPRNTVAQCL